jgi:hypothetical protein
MGAYVLRESEGRSYRCWEPGYLFTVKADGKETDRAFAFVVVKASVLTVTRKPQPARFT